MDFSKVFQKLGVLDYPLLGIANGASIGASWQVSEIRSGEVLWSSSTFRTASSGVRSTYIITVLDGDHFLTDQCEIFSITEGKVIEEVLDLKAFLRGKASHKAIVRDLNCQVESLPAPKEYSHTMSSLVSPIFDHNQRTEKLVFFHPANKRIQIWDWLPTGGRSERNESNKLEKNHDMKFDAEGGVQQVIPVPGSNRILVMLDDDTFIYDVQKRETLGKTHVPDEESTLLLPDDRPGLILKERDQAVLMRLSEDGKKQEIARFDWEYSSQLVMKDLETSGKARAEDFQNPEHFNIVLMSFPSSLKLLRTKTGETREVIMDGKPFDFGKFTYPQLSLHGNDVMVTKKEKRMELKKITTTTPWGGQEDAVILTRKAFQEGLGPEEGDNVFIFDLLTGEVKGKFSIPEITARNCVYLPGDLYLVSGKNCKLLFGFRGRRYEFLGKRNLEFPLPISKGQRKVMNDTLVGLFPETSIPIAVINVVSGFI